MRFNLEKGRNRFLKMPVRISVHGKLDYPEVLLTFPVTLAKFPNQSLCLPADSAHAKVKRLKTQTNKRARNTIREFSSRSSNLIKPTQSILVLW